MTDKQEQGFFTVSIHLVDRAFGGHEEGGWYYDYGIPQTDPEFAIYCMGFDTWEGAAQYADEINDKSNMLKERNKGRAPISSVASEGIYMAVVQSGFPRPWPEAKPQYE